MRRWKAWLEWAYPKPVSSTLTSGYLPTFYCKHKTDSLLFSIIQSHCKGNSAGHNELQNFCVANCFSVGQWRTELCVRWSTITFRASCSCVTWQPLYWPVDWHKLELLYHCSSWGLKEEFWIRVFQVSVVWPKYWGDF